MAAPKKATTKPAAKVETVKKEAAPVAPNADNAPVEDREEKPVAKAKAAAVYGYAKGDKDPTKYDVTDQLFGHAGGPRHLEWLTVNG